jgi:hypothetical protein
LLEQLHAKLDDISAVMPGAEDAPLEPSLAREIEYYSALRAAVDGALGPEVRVANVIAAIDAVRIPEEEPWFKIPMCHYFVLRIFAHPGSVLTQDGR